MNHSYDTLFINEEIPMNTNKDSMINSEEMFNMIWGVTVQNTRLGIQGEVNCTALMVDGKNRIITQICTVTPDGLQQIHDGLTQCPELVKGIQVEVLDATTVKIITDVRKTFEVSQRLAMRLFKDALNEELGSSEPLIVLEDSDCVAPTIH